MSSTGGLFQQISSTVVALHRMSSTGGLLQWMSSTDVALLRMSSTGGLLQQISSTCGLLQQISSTAVAVCKLQTWTSSGLDWSMFLIRDVGFTCTFACTLITLGQSQFAAIFIWPKNFDFRQVLLSSASLCLCVCQCVCESVYRLSQKVLDRFWWNLAGWCRMIRYRFLSKMRWIGLVERIPHPLEMFKSPYLRQSP